MNATTTTKAARKPARELKGLRTTARTQASQLNRCCRCRCRCGR